MKKYLAMGVGALAATLLIRHFVYTPDANLLVVGFTFVLLYLAIWGTTALALALRKRCSLDKKCQ